MNQEGRLKDNIVKVKHNKITENISQVIQNAVVMISIETIGKRKTNKRPS